MMRQVPVVAKRSQALGNRTEASRTRLRRKKKIGENEKEEKGRNKKGDGKRM